MADDVEIKKSKLATYFSKIISGFLTGLGFSIAMIMVFSFAGYLYEHSFKEKTKLSTLETYKSSRIEFDENSGLVIQSHEPQRLENKLIILGKVKNNGQDSWEHINIDVELFDSNKVFVDQCSTYISGTIKPNQTRNFKVTCGGCNNEPLVDFSTYEINIVDAFHDK